MKFFRYEPSFVDWLLTYAVRRPILDVGTGEGHLLRDLLARTFRAHGTEVRRVASPDVENHVALDPVIAEKLSSLGGWLLVLARPCHGPFMQSILCNAKSEVLVLTRPSTVEADAGPYFSKMRVVDAPGVLPALDGEEIVCYSFVPERRGWYNMDREVPKDQSASRPDWAVFGDDGVSFHGWISPSGLLCSCRFFEHDRIAYKVIELDPQELMLMGWRRTRVDEGTLVLSSRYSVGFSGDDDAPTDAQLRVLEMLDRRRAGRL